MKKIKKFSKLVKKELKENKSSFLVYIGLRLLVIIIMILQFFNGNYENVFLCLLTLFMFLMPSILQAKFMVEFPSTLEIIIFLFIFSAEILGEMSSFYLRFLYWDTLLHTINGFICAALGLSLVDILNEQDKLEFELSPLFMVIFAFCFSMTIGIFWEFFEFGMDNLLGLDMQKDTMMESINTTFLDKTKSNQIIKIENIQKISVDNNLIIEGYLDIGLYDTMYDLLVNFIGAIIFSIFGFFYLKNKDEKSFIRNLIPRKWNNDKKNNLE